MGTTTTIYVRAARDAVRRAVASLPAAARSGGPAGVAIMARVGRAVQGRIRASFLVKMRGGRDETGDRWQRLKQQTVRRKIRKGSIGGRSRPVDILRDAGPLLDSLSPHGGSEHRIFRVSAGAVEVGTDRKGAAAHHRGAPSRNLPQRRLWPDPSNWTPTWWAPVLEQARDSLIDAAAALIQEVSR